LPVLLTGLAVRFAGTYVTLDWLTAASLLPCLAGLLLLVGGRPALRWGWPAVAFLLFMVPLPYRLEIALAHPLQHAATWASTYALQTVGLAAFAEGNIIRLGEVRIGVVEACSGLSMLVIFFALCTAVVLVAPLPPVDKGLIVLSAIPIALAANVARITVTGVLHKTAGGDWANLVFHDLSGWLMMPLALALLWLEVRLLRWVLPPVTPRVVQPMQLARWREPGEPVLADDGSRPRLPGRTNGSRARQRGRK
jgi:exosortase